MGNINPYFSQEQSSEQIATAMQINCLQQLILFRFHHKIIPQIMWKDLANKISYLKDGQTNMMDAMQKKMNKHWSSAT